MTYVKEILIKVIIILCSLISQPVPHGNHDFIAQVAEEISHRRHLHFAARQGAHLPSFPASLICTIVFPEKLNPKALNYPGFGVSSLCVQLVVTREKEVEKILSIQGLFNLYFTHVPTCLLITPRCIGISHY